MKFLQTTAILIFVLISFPTVNAQTQTSCGTGVPPEGWEAELQKLLAQCISGQTSNRPQQQLYTVPVIFHVIHGGEAPGTFPNLPQSAFSSQVAALNNDFAGTGMGYGAYPVNAFAAWASTANISPASLNANGGVAIANCGVQFCLATRDTNGNILPEPGIERIDYTSRGWINPAGPMTVNPFFKLYDSIIKPQTIWNVTKYLNVWVLNCATNMTGIVGFALYPYLSTLNGLPGVDIGAATNDGIWCYAGTLGGNSHVLSHEAGHWLGLKHTWGDTLCGNDYCNDTPPAPAPTSGAPNYPHFVNACGSAGNGVMFMNVMDYTYTNYMFTTDQANRIQTAMANSPYRKYLGTHNLCSVEQSSTVAEFSAANSLCLGKPLLLNNYSQGWPAPSYTWTSSGGTIVPGPQAVAPAVQFNTAGIYTITLTAFNGGMSVVTRTVNITMVPLNFSALSQTICQNTAANFTVQGASTYTWFPGNTMNASVSFTPASSQTYTCIATDLGKCARNGVVNVMVSECTGIDKAVTDDLNFQIYPNPADKNLNLQIDTRLTWELSLQISDAMGRTVYRHQIHVTPGQLLSVDISTFDNGIYFMKVQSPGGSTKTEKFVKRD